MKKIQKLFRFFSIMGLISTIFFFSLIYCYEKILPDNYYSIKKEDFDFNSALSILPSLPFNAYPTPFSDNLDNKEEIKTNIKADAVINDEYTVDIKLFGLFPIKQARVKIVSSQSVIPGGEPFGMKMFSQGVMITGFSDIKTGGQVRCPATECGLKKGDLILSINGKSIKNNDDVIAIIENSIDGVVEFQIKRNQTALNIKLNAVKNELDGKYKAGVWVRDSSAGIGTITFYNIESGSFAGLGHPVCDVDTGAIVPLRQGEICSVEIDSVIKGKSGSAGELKGHFKNISNIGVLWSNKNSGVYGNITEPLPTKESLEIGLKQEIKTGEAFIYTTIDSKGPQKYKISIEKINISQDSDDTKNMIIKITDPELLEKTGGIVQGMSGSPIIQNNKVVGAVTHVFLNDPLCGYGIFAEVMRDELVALETNLKSVS